MFSSATPAQLPTYQADESEAFDDESYSSEDEAPKPSPASGGVANFNRKVDDDEYSDEDLPEVIRAARRAQTAGAEAATPAVPTGPDAAEESDKSDEFALGDELNMKIVDSNAEAAKLLSTARDSSDSESESSSEDEAPRPVGRRRPAPKSPVVDESSDSESESEEDVPLSAKERRLVALAKRRMEMAAARKKAAAEAAAAESENESDSSNSEDGSSSEEEGPRRSPVRRSVAGRSRPGSAGASRRTPVRARPLDTDSEESSDEDVRSPSGRRSRAGSVSHGRSRSRSGSTLRSPSRSRSRSRTRNVEYSDSEYSEDEPAHRRTASRSPSHQRTPSRGHARRLSASHSRTLSRRRLDDYSDYSEYSDDGRLDREREHRLMRNKHLKARSPRTTGFDALETGMRPTPVAGSPVAPAKARPTGLPTAAGTRDVSVALAKNKHLAQLKSQRGLCFQLFCGAFAVLGWFLLLLFLSLCAFGSYTFYITNDPQDIDSAAVWDGGVGNVLRPFTSLSIKPGVINTDPSSAFDLDRATSTATFAVGTQMYHGDQYQLIAVASSRNDNANAESSDSFVDVYLRDGSSVTYEQVTAIGERWTFLQRLTAPTELGDCRPTGRITLTSKVVAFSCVPNGSNMAPAIVIYRRFKSEYLNMGTLHSGNSKADTDAESDIIFGPIDEERIAILTLHNQVSNRKVVVWYGPDDDEILDIYRERKGGSLAGFLGDPEVGNEGSVDATSVLPLSKEDGVATGTRFIEVRTASLAVQKAENPWLVTAPSDTFGTGGDGVFAVSTSMVGAFGIVEGAIPAHLNAGGAAVSIFVLTGYNDQLDTPLVVPLPRSHTNVNADDAAKAVPIFIAPYWHGSKPNLDIVSDQGLFYDPSNTTYSELSGWNYGLDNDVPQINTTVFVDRTNFTTHGPGVDLSGSQWDSPRAHAFELVTTGGVDYNQFPGGLGTCPLASTMVFVHYNGTNYANTATTTAIRYLKECRVPGMVAALSDIVALAGPKDLSYTQSPPGGNYRQSCDDNVVRNTCVRARRTLTLPGQSKVFHSWNGRPGYAEVIEQHLTRDEFGTYVGETVAGVNADDFGRLSSTAGGIVAIPDSATEDGSVALLSELHLADVTPLLVTLMGPRAPAYSSDPNVAPTGDDAYNGCFYWDRYYHPTFRLNMSAAALADGVYAAGGPELYKFKLKMINKVEYDASELAGGVVSVIVPEKIIVTGGQRHNDYVDIKLNTDLLTAAQLGDLGSLQVSYYDSAELSATELVKFEIDLTPLDTSAKSQIAGYNAGKGLCRDVCNLECSGRGYCSNTGRCLCQFGQLYSSIPAVGPSADDSACSIVETPVHVASTTAAGVGIVFGSDSPAFTMNSDQSILFEVTSNQYINRLAAILPPLMVNGGKPVKTLPVLSAWSTADTWFASSCRDSGLPVIDPTDEYALSVQGALYAAAPLSQTARHQLSGGFWNSAVYEGKKAISGSTAGLTAVQHTCSEGSLRLISGIAAVTFVCLVFLAILTWCVIAPALRRWRGDSVLKSRSDYEREAQMAVRRENRPFSDMSSATAVTKKAMFNLIYEQKKKLLEHAQLSVEETEAALIGAFEAEPMAIYNAAVASGQFLEQ